VQEFPVSSIFTEVWIEHVDESFPSIGAIIQESAHKTGIALKDPSSNALDNEWRRAIKEAFLEHPNQPTVEHQLVHYFKTSHSQGRKLKLQILRLPPGKYLKLHAHPNLEFEVTLAGNLQEFRFLFTVPPEELHGQDPVGPIIASNHMFTHVEVPAGHCLVNEVGSVHQSFVKSHDKQPCTMLVLWSGCHANTPPSRMHNPDPRLHPHAGWD